MIIQISGVFEAIAIIVGSIGVIGGGLYWFYLRVLKPVHVVITTAAELISRELQPNHGSSFYDMVNNHLIEAKVDRDDFRNHLIDPKAHNGN